MAQSETTLTKPIMPGVYHPDYGFPDDYRREIMAYADQTCVADAAYVYNVSRSTIYKWRKDMGHDCAQRIGRRPRQRTSR